MLPTLGFVAALSLYKLYIWKRLDWLPLKQYTPCELKVALWEIIVFTKLTEQTHVFAASSTQSCRTVIWSQNCQVFYDDHKSNSPGLLAKPLKLVIGCRTLLQTKYQLCSARTLNYIVVDQTGNWHICELSALNRWEYNSHYFSNYFYRFQHSFICTVI